MSAAVSGYLRTLLPTLTDLTVPARHLAETLGHYANRDGEAWCSVATLATRTGLHPGTIRKARAALVAAGVIAVDLSSGGHPAATNRYRFPIAGFIHTPRPERGVSTGNPAPWARDPAPWARQPRAHGATKIHRSNQEDPAATVDNDTGPPAAPPWVLQGVPRAVWLARIRTGEAS